MKERNYKYVKVVETQQVTAEVLEQIININIGEGWILDSIHFAMRDSSKRPSMAFLTFYDPEYAKKMHTATPEHIEPK